MIFIPTDYKQVLLLKLRTCLPAGRDGVDEIATNVVIVNNTSKLN